MSHTTTKVPRKKKKGREKREPESMCFFVKIITANFSHALDKPAMISLWLEESKDAYVDPWSPERARFMREAGGNPPCVEEFEKINVRP